MLRITQRPKQQRCVLNSGLHLDFLSHQQFLSRRLSFLVPSLADAVLVVDKDAVIWTAARLRDILTYNYSGHSQYGTRADEYSYTRDMDGPKCIPTPEFSFQQVSLTFRAGVPLK